MLLLWYVQPHGFQKLNELADFSDIVEPESSESEETDDVVQDDVKQRETRASLFKTAGEELSGTGETRKPVPSEDLGKLKRDVAKKYKDLLDLKYYLVRNFPKTSVGLKNLSTYSINKRDIRKLLKERRKKKRSNMTGKADEKQMRQVDDVTEGKSKRARLNILQMMAEYNPYIKKLADATNDEYLKMRNYAATMMIILTTKRPVTTRYEEELRHNSEKAPYLDEVESASTQDFEEMRHSSESEPRYGEDLQNAKRKNCVLDKNGNCEVRLANNVDLDSKKPHREQHVSRSGTNEELLPVHQHKAKAPRNKESSPLNNRNDQKSSVDNKNSVTETPVALVKGKKFIIRLRSNQKLPKNRKFTSRIMTIMIKVKILTVFSLHETSTKKM